jgi:hypothetical protein
LLCFFQTPRDQEFANEWTTRSESYYRRSRDDIIKRGGSPPPKFHEDNLFTEGCSRLKAKSAFRLKGESDCWEDQHEEKYFGNTVEEYTNGRLRPSKKMKEQETDQKEQQKSANKEVDEEDNGCSESDDEDSSSEEEDQGGVGIDEREDEESSSDDEERDEEGTKMSCERRNNDKEYKDSDGGKDEPDAVKKRRIDEVENDDETISAIFDKIAKGSYDVNKIKQRNKKGRRDFWKERKVWCPTSNQTNMVQERTSNKDQ